MVLAERSIYRKLPLEIPEAEQLISRFVLGDQDAFTAIDDYLRPSLVKFFSVRLQTDADDLTQETLMRIARGLSKFRDRYSEEPDFSHHFVLSCFKIAKNVLNTRLRRLISKDRLTVILTTDPDSQKDVSTDTLLSKKALRNNQSLPSIEDEISKEEQEAKQRQSTIILKEKIANVLLHSYQIRIINLALDGKSKEEIAAELRYKHKEVIGRVFSEARVKIEKELIFPAGYRRAVRFGPNVHMAAFKGRLPAVKFLGILYITEEDVLRWQNTKRGVDKELLDSGYLSILMLSPQEAQILRAKHPQLLKQHRGLTYIRKEQLEKFRRSVPGIIRPESVGENSHYIKIIKFAKTQREYSILLYAARKGRLKTVKQGHRWFTTQEAVEEFNKGEVTIFDSIEPPSNPL